MSIEKIKKLKFKYEDELRTLEPIDVIDYDGDELIDFPELGIERKHVNWANTQMDAVSLDGSPNITEKVLQCSILIVRNKKDAESMALIHLRAFQTINDHGKEAETFRKLGLENDKSALLIEGSISSSFRYGGFLEHLKDRFGIETEGLIQDRFGR